MLSMESVGNVDQKEVEKDRSAPRDHRHYFLEYFLPGFYFIPMCNFHSAGLMLFIQFHILLSPHYAYSLEVVSHVVTSSL